MSSSPPHQDVTLSDEDEEIGALVYSHSRTAQRILAAAAMVEAKASEEGCSVGG
eukprot:CAMPEP_0183709424 /NCGR_PEP_ID=MMETSP0737-20130205/5483_1 /TAXON_ID=385413 /ORGANISM="Thalassiosira miniscula, Strain CCMP1093" /LENGTH=53 /DNA_ID=CAMNT_0025937529 /DNA_START=197 /DNA_END=355 /DNA_ORIENTATION=+